jgi:hypothetical protein
MASEIHVFACVHGWIAGETAHVRSLKPVGVAKIRQLHRTTVGGGNREVFKSRRSSVCRLRRDDPTKNRDEGRSFHQYTMGYILRRRDRPGRSKRKRSKQPATRIDDTLTFSRDYPDNFTLSQRHAHETLDSRLLRTAYPWLDAEFSGSRPGSRISGR